MDTTELARLADHLAIQQTLYRYARGIDRCDAQVLAEVWWPGCRVDYGSGEEDAHEWSRNVVEALSGMLRTQHMLGNMLIEIDGSTAEAETYCHAYHEVAGADGAMEMDVGGRYLDRLEKRGGEWRIAHRRYVLDWNANRPSTSLWDEGMYAGLARRGARKPEDPSYTGK
ncbi:MAG: nuclear transport factor 2 family protein [Erythrobacter sp.]|uniref:nuclear transport factor 2 family protein n=1 Tax=Erythrobacter sp. TaxID=1042 RepID=UPI003C7619DC